MLKNRFFDISTTNKCRACSLYNPCRVGHFLNFVGAKFVLGFVLLKSIAQARGRTFIEWPT